jgi:hypothetical protein
MSTNTKKDFVHFDLRLMSLMGFTCFYFFLFFAFTDELAKINTIKLSSQQKFTTFTTLNVSAAAALERHL